MPLADAGLGWQGALAVWALLGAAGVRSSGGRSHARAHHVPPEEARAPVRLRRSALAWQVTLFMGLQSLLFYCLIAWLPALLEDEGLSRTAAGWMLAVLQISSLAATMSVPVLAARRASQRRLVLLGSVSCLIGFAGLLADGRTLALLWTCFLGIGTGACFALALSFFALRAPDAAPRRRAVGHGAVDRLRARGERPDPDRLPARPDRRWDASLSSCSASRWPRWPSACSPPATARSLRLSSSAGARTGRVDRLGGPLAGERVCDRSRRAHAHVVHRLLRVEGDVRRQQRALGLEQRVAGRAAARGRSVQAGARRSALRERRDQRVLVDERRRGRC